MKKHILVLAALIITLIGSANIAPPMAHISEVYFDTQNNWTLEIGFYGSIEDIEFIKISNSTGTALVTTLNLIAGNSQSGFDSLAIITNANLDSALFFTPLNDYIKVETRVWNYEPFDILHFGEHPNSIVQCIEQGESICQLSRMLNDYYVLSWCINSLPSLGFLNDTTGSLATFAGIVKDQAGNPVTEGHINLAWQGSYQRLRIQADGSLNERIFARDYLIDTIWYKPDLSVAYETYAIDPISVCLKPNDLHNQNIVLSSPVGISEIKKDTETKIVASPNPFSNEISFYYSFNTEDNNSADDLKLSIFTLSGKKVDELDLHSYQDRVVWKAGIAPSGILFYHFTNSKQILAKGKLVKI
jgi:hypothetical protein